MAEILLDEQGAPSTPASGKMLLYPDSSASVFVQKNDAGRVEGDASRASVAALTLNAANTYVTNSGLIMPAHGIQAGMVWEWKMSASKTAAGIAAPIYTVVIGSLQTTGDTIRQTLTGPAQTAIADIGLLTILVIARAGGSGTILAGSAHWSHRGTAASTTVSGTGFANDVSGAVENTAATFDSSAMAGQYVGLCINPGASGVWTMTQAFGRNYY